MFIVLRKENWHQGFSSQTIMINVILHLKCSFVLNKENWRRVCFYYILIHVWNVLLFTARKIDTKCIPSKLLCSISFYISNVPLFSARKIYKVFISKFTIFLLNVTNVPLFSRKFDTKSIPAKHLWIFKLHLKCSIVHCKENWHQVYSIHTVMFNFILHLKCSIVLDKKNLHCVYFKVFNISSVCYKCSFVLK